MKWYWYVRIYDKHGNYWHAQIETGQDLQEIDTIQDFYQRLTGCKMLLEGMGALSRDVEPLRTAFDGLWKPALTN